MKKSMAHYRKANHLIPWGTQTRAKSPGIILNNYNGVAPLYFKKAKDCFMWDVDGKRYIDYRASLGPIILGYCNKEVDNAVKKQIDKGIIYSMPGDLECKLAEMMTEAVPSVEMVRFLKTGAEAVSAALRIARAYTGREIVLSQGYHGWHDIFMVNESAGIPQCLKDCIYTFKYGDLSTVKELMGKLGEKVACIILNPFDGFEKPQAGYLDDMKKLAEKYESVLIFDEVKTGFRLSLGGAQEKYSVRPHLSVFAKAMANGYPMSAVGGSAEIMETLNRKEPRPTVVTNTLCGDLSSIAASIETIKILRRKNTFKKLDIMGKKLMDGLNEIFKRHGIDGRASGEPTYFRSEIKGTCRKSGTALQLLFLTELMKQGIFSLGEWLIYLAHTDETVSSTLECADNAAVKIKKDAL